MTFDQQFIFIDSYEISPRRSLRDSRIVWAYNSSILKVDNDTEWVYGHWRSLNGCMVSCVHWLRTARWELLVRRGLPTSRKFEPDHPHCHIQRAFQRSQTLLEITFSRSLEHVNMQNTFLQQCLQNPAKAPLAFGGNQLTYIGPNCIFWSASRGSFNIQAKPRSCSKVINSLSSYQRPSEVCIAGLRRAGAPIAIAQCWNFKRGMGVERRPHAMTRGAGLVELSFSQTSNYPGTFLTVRCVVYIVATVWYLFCSGNLSANLIVGPRDREALRESSWISIKYWTLVLYLDYKT